MNKRTLKRLRRILMRSRLAELAAWYAAHKPEVTVMAISSALADDLDAAPNEAAELGVTPIGDGTGADRQYALKRGTGPAFLLYPHG